MAFTETRKLPCCGTTIPWDPEWFARVNGLPGVHVREEGVLASLAASHVCPPKPVRYLGPWQPHGEEWAAEVRFAEPHDGRTWSLDGSPRWIVLVSPCCTLDPERAHFVWTIGDKTDGDRPSGSEKTRDAAKAAAEAALVQLGWVLSP